MSTIELDLHCLVLTGEELEGLKLAIRTAEDMWYNDSYHLAEKIAIKKDLGMAVSDDDADYLEGLKGRLSLITKARHAIEASKDSVEFKNTIKAYAEKIVEQIKQQARQ